MSTVYDRSSRLGAMVGFPPRSIDSDDLSSTSKLDTAGVACGHQPGLGTSGMLSVSLKRCGV